MATAAAASTAHAKSTNGWEVSSAWRRDSKDERSRGTNLWRDCRLQGRVHYIVKHHHLTWRTTRCVHSTCRSWKVVKFKFSNFSDMESHRIRPCSSWKVLEMKSTKWLPLFWPMNTKTHLTAQPSPQWLREFKRSPDPLATLTKCKNLTSSITTRLNSPGMSRKIHKWSWKVTKTTFSVLYSPCVCHSCVLIMI